MNKTEKLLLAASAGLGLVLAVTALTGRGKGAAPAGAPGPAAATPTAAAPAHSPTGPPTLELLVTERAVLTPVPPGIRDPFRPRDTSPIRADGGRRPAQQTGAEKVAQLTLTGLLEEKGEPVAFINKQVVRAGDIIEGLRVLLVTNRGVWLEYRGERFYLELYKRLNTRDEPGRRDGAGPTDH